MILQHLPRLDLEDMSQKPVLNHLVMQTFQDGLSQKLEDQQMIKEDQIETKPMILDRPSAINLTLRTRLHLVLTLGLAHAARLIDWVLSQIRCKEA